MKKALTGPDIRELVSGWQFLIGSRLDQFGRPDSDKLIFKLRNIERGTIRLVVDFRGWTYLTKKSITTESNQGVFVNQVRKAIKKSRLDSVTQLNGDRIISFDFVRKDKEINLILELFHKGNAILCEEGKIITIMRQQKFRHRILNIGNNKTVELMTYISALENELGKKARKNFLPLQEGDIQNTASDTSKINTLVGFKAKTDIEEGIRNFVKWYKEYHGV